MYACNTRITTQWVAVPPIFLPQGIIMGSLSAPHIGPPNLERLTPGLPPPTRSRGVFGREGDRCRGRRGLTWLPIRTTRPAPFPNVDPYALMSCAEALRSAIPKTESVRPAASAPWVGEYWAARLLCTFGAGCWLYSYTTAFWLNTQYPLFVLLPFAAIVFPSLLWQWLLS